MDVDRIAPTAFVGEVLMKQEIIPFLRAAQATERLAVEPPPATVSPFVRRKAPLGQRK